MNNKTVTIKQVELTDTQLEDRCSTCSLNLSNQCQTNVKSFLVNSHGFTNCELGCNYKVDDLEVDYVLDALPTPTTLEDALVMIGNLKTINSVQSFAIKRQRNIVKALEASRIEMEVC